MVEVWIGTMALQNLQQYGCQTGNKLKDKSHDLNRNSRRNKNETMFRSGYENCPDSIFQIYNYLCNQCLSLLMWVWISIRARFTTLYNWWLSMRWIQGLINPCFHRNWKSLTVLIWGRCNLKCSQRTVIFLPVYKISSLKIYNTLPKFGSVNGRSMNRYYGTSKSSTIWLPNR
jgi:hypothetical protein